MRTTTEGFGAAGLIALATALAVLLSIGLPIVIATDQIKLSDWVGFGGNVLGAGVTLVAAYIAWRAVQRQINEQHKLIESQRRDAANVRLTEHLLAIQECFAAYNALPATTTRTSEEFAAFQVRVSDPRLMATALDPLMGQDAGLIGLLIISMKFAADARAGNSKADPLGRHDTLVDFLFVDLVDSFRERRAAMRNGSVDDLTDLALLNRESYYYTLETGEPPTHRMLLNFRRQQAMKAKF